MLSVSEARLVCADSLAVGGHELLGADDLALLLLLGSGLLEEEHVGDVVREAEQLSDDSGTVGNQGHGLHVAVALIELHIFLL